MATMLLLRTLTRSRLLPSSYSTSQSLSVAAAAAACSNKWLTSDVKKPWSSIFPLGKQMASFGRPFSSGPAAGNSTEEKGMEDVEGEAAENTNDLDGEPCFHVLQTRGKVMRPWDDRYGVVHGKIVPLDQARVTMFKKWKEEAEFNYGFALSRAVVILSANANDAILHQMIRDAATTAGLDVQKIIVKPNAVAYPYGLQLIHGDPITTFNFSGSLEKVIINQYHDIPYSCSPGKETDFDNVLVLCLDFLMRVHGADITKDPFALQSFKEALGRALVSKCNKVRVKLQTHNGTPHIVTLHLPPDGYRGPF